MIPDSAVIVGIAATLIGSILAVVLPRALDNRRRNRRQLDLMTAIHAEIMSGTAATTAQSTRLGLAGQRRELERRLMAERANLAMPRAR